MIQNVAIVGLGALGIMYAEHFTNKIGKANVRIIVNKERKDRYEKLGVFANGKECDFNYVDETHVQEPVDLIIFAVKKSDLESSIQTVQNQMGDHTIIMSVLNGISSEEIIAETYGNANIIHCVAQSMDAVREGNALRFQNMGELRMGIDSSEKQPLLDATAAFFDKTAFPYTLEADIKHRLWNKFMLNVGVNQVVMVAEGTYGTVKKAGEARDLMIAAMREVIAIANAEGVALTEADLAANVAMIDPLSSDNMPSMRQDGLAKRYSEVDLFSGTVLEKGKSHQIETPTNQYLYNKVKEIEATY